MPTAESLLHSSKGKIAVATTVMLTFISFWRAAAIVLNDMASSAYYVGGIAEQTIGKSAPWFILGVMLFSYLMRLVYLESTMIFTRGGLYPVVKATLGGTLAKLSVSALIFDYVLTGPISSVVAGQYVMNLFNRTLVHYGHTPVGQNFGSVILACAIILYFWWQNIRGIEESSSKAMKIMQVTSIMVIVLIAWSVFTLLQIDWQLPTFETHLQDHALGWLQSYSFPYEITAIAVAVGLGHSFLGMSGLETFAQVSREIAHPKLLNLKRAGLIIFLFTLVFTTLVSFFAVTIIPDAARSLYLENLISGIAAYLHGPAELRIAFDMFVVLVGVLILSGASNTALIGSNAVLNQISEDGVLTSWFRKPHPKFGTSYRTINTVVLLQLATIVASRGDIYLLGEAYAFGVLWSFFFQTLSVTVLRYKDKSPREYRFPINLYLGKLEIPVGLLVTLTIIFIIAITNLFTKQIATIAGISFASFLFIVLSISERRVHRKGTSEKIGLDVFQIESTPSISHASIGCRPHGILVPVIQSKDLSHLNAMLKTTDTKTKDLIVMTTRLLQGTKVGSTDVDIFTDQEQEIFTDAVRLAEKHGKFIRLVVTASNDTYYAIAQTAFKLNCESIVMRVSANVKPIQQAKALSEGWDKLPNALKKDILIKIWRDGDFILKWNALPPLPDIQRETLRGINFLYRELNSDEGDEKISRSRIIDLAIQRLLHEYQSGQFVWKEDQNLPPPNSDEATDPPR